MSDFFASLLDRAQQRAPVLQWRQPSMFEGQDLHSPIAPLEQESLAPRLSRPPATPVVAPTETTASPTQPILLAPAPLLEKHAVAIPQIEATAPVTQRNNEAMPSIVAPNIERRETIRETVNTVNTLQTREIHHQHHTTVVQREQASPLAARPALAPFAMPSNKPLQTIRVESAVNKAATPASKAAASQVESRAPLRPVRAPAPALTPPALARLRSTQQPIATPAPLPTVQVSIGRIEIKANTPPPPARSATRPAGPKLTLDEYLRSQNGGRK